MSGANPTATAAAMMPPHQLQKNASFNLSLDPFQKDDFFEQIGMDPCRDLRNTTDDLTIKFFEAAETTQHQGAPHNHGHPAPFAPFDPSYSSQSASGMFPSPLGFPEKRVPAQQEQSTGGYQQHQNQQQF